MGFRRQDMDAVELVGIVAVFPQADHALPELVGVLPYAVDHAALLDLDLAKGLPGP